MRPRRSPAWLWLAQSVHAARRITAELIVECLENEGVTHVFGIPGEENIRLVDALWAQLESSMIPCGFTR